MIGVTEVGECDKIVVSTIDQTLNEDSGRILCCIVLRYIDLIVQVYPYMCSLCWMEMVDQNV